MCCCVGKSSAPISGRGSGGICLKILVVDDEDLLVKGIKYNLKSDGYEVITGSTGLDAVRLTQEEKPDLVILDIMMPEMDGLTACSRIREFSNVPIIFLTAKSDDMDKLIGFDHGTDEHSGAEGTNPGTSAALRLRRSNADREPAHHRLHQSGSGRPERIPG